MKAISGFMQEVTDSSDQTTADKIMKEYKEAFEQSKLASGTVNQHQHSLTGFGANCPYCGRCPTCGRSNYWRYPYYKPHWEYQPYYQPTVWC